MLFSISFNKGVGKEETNNYIFVNSKDFNSYVDPAINFIETGTCFELMANKKLYAHKMPGMVPILAPLYFLFGYSWSLTFLVILQFIADVIACVMLASITFKLTKNRAMTWVSFSIFTLSTIVSVSSHYAVSELFCTCFSIYSFYFVIFSYKNNGYWTGGLFAAWAIFFRPTAILLLIVIPLLLLGLKKQNYFIHGIQLKKAVIIFLTPFIFFESCWIIRNYVLMERFIPAEISQENFGDPAFKSLISLIQSIGGDNQSWNPDSEMRWFNTPGTINYDSNFAESNPFPNYALSNGMPLDSLLNLRSKYYRYTFNTQNFNIQIEDSIVRQSNRLILSFKKQAPLYYYFISPLRIVKTFLFIKRPYGFSFKVNGVLEKSIRFWHYAFYQIILWLSIISFVFVRKMGNLKVLVLFVISHVFIYGIILRLSENRYIVPIYPFMSILASFAIIQLFTKFQNKFKLLQNHNFGN